MGNDGQDKGKRWDGSASSGAEEVVPVFPAWACTPGECLVELGVSADHGLSSEEAAMWLQLYGPNELERHALLLVWKLVLEQFDDMLVHILLLVAVVSFMLALYDGTKGSFVGCGCPGSGGDGFGVGQRGAGRDRWADQRYPLRITLDKIKDANHSSKQMEALTNKMRDCKRLIKDFERVSKGEVGRTDPENAKNDA